MKNSGETFRSIFLATLRIGFSSNPGASIKSPKEAVKRDVGVTPMSPTFGVAGLGEQQGHTLKHIQISFYSRVTSDATPPR